MSEILLFEHSKTILLEFIPPLVCHRVKIDLSTINIIYTRIITCKKKNTYLQKTFHLQHHMAASVSPSSAQ